MFEMVVYFVGVIIIGSALNFFDRRKGFPCDGSNFVVATFWPLFMCVIIVALPFLIIGWPLYILVQFILGKLFTEDKPNVKKSIKKTS